MHRNLVPEDAISYNVHVCMYVCMYVKLYLLTYIYLYLYLRTYMYYVHVLHVYVHYYEYLHLLGTMFYYITFKIPKGHNLFFNSLTPPPPPQSSATDAPLLPLPSIFFLDPCIKVSEVNLVPRKKDSNADMVPSSIDLSECSAAWL